MQNFAQDFYFIARHATLQIFVEISGNNYGFSLYWLKIVIFTFNFVVIAVKACADHRFYSYGLFLQSVNHISAIVTGFPAFH